MVNLITRMVSMEIVWVLVLSCNFYGDFMVKLDRRLLGVSMEKTW